MNNKLMMGLTLSLVVILVAISVSFYNTDNLVLEPESMLDNSKYLSDKVGLKKSNFNKKEVLAADLNESNKKSKKVNLSQKTRYKLATIKNNLQKLMNCDANNSCPIDNTDPRASSLLLGQKIAEQLAEYRKISEQNDYLDQDSIALVMDVLDDKDGYVQEEAIHLMSMHEPMDELGSSLINALEGAFDAKIFNQSLIELQRYPNLAEDIQTLLSNTLSTGSFYAAQEVATNILPFLNTNNIQHYIAVANSLPQNSVRARALHSNIREYQLRVLGG